MSDLHKCPTCETETEAFMCARCVLLVDKRRIAGMRLSTDYDLVPGDYLVNALAFIHACGALEDFIDRVESTIPQITMGGSANVIHPEQVIDSDILEQYNSGRRRERYYGWRRW